jgi:hypothetical protein
MGERDNLPSAVVWGLDTGGEEVQDRGGRSRMAGLRIPKQGDGHLPVGRAGHPDTERSAPGNRSAVLGAAAWEAMYRSDLDRGGLLRPSGRRLSLLLGAERPG